MPLFTWSGRESELVSEPKDSVHVLQELHAACHLGLETATFVFGLKNALVCKHSGTHVVWQHILINAMYYRAELGTYLVKYSAAMMKGRIQCRMCGCRM